MSMFPNAPVQEDEDAPVDPTTGRAKFERRDLQPYRAELATLVDGKIRRRNFLTGDVIEPEIGEDGKVKNKNRIGRGTIEYGHELGFAAVGREDEEGRSLRITHQRMGIDPRPDSEFYGQDVTQLRLQWTDKREMSPVARAGLNRRILQNQALRVNEAADALGKDQANAVLKAAHALAVVKLNTTKARLSAEAKPADEALAKALADGQAKVAEAEALLKKVTSEAKANGQVAVDAPTAPAAPAPAAAVRKAAAPR